MAERRWNSQLALPWRSLFCIAGCRMIREAVASPAVLPAADGLRCCSVGARYTLHLACEDSVDDRITGIDYAFLGDAAGGASTCGAELDAACGTHVEQVVGASCIGRPTCDLSVDALVSEGFGCQSAAAQQLRVRWACGHERHEAAPVPLIDLPLELPRKPLRAKGSIIVDARGERVQLAGVTWGSFHINHAPDGLDVTPAGSLAKVIRRLGFNVIRATVSVQGVVENALVRPSRLAANPRLVGARFLEVLDAVVAALEAEGVMVWLDVHMLESGWCCSHSDGNGLWFNEKYAESDWLDALRTLTRRYGSRRNVIGIGLKNEPRPVCTGTHGSRSYNVSELFVLAGGVQQPDPYHMISKGDECVVPQWSDGPELFQHRLAMERGGRAVLDVNPDLLVGISGLSYSQFLDAVEHSPASLPAENVVYEAHEYHWYHRHFDVEANFSQALEAYTRVVDAHWGSVLKKAVAPVFVSEFGFSHAWATQKNEVAWLRLWQSYASGQLQGGLDVAYWQLAGVQTGGAGRVEGSEETFGVLNRCFTAPWSPDHFDALRDFGLAKFRRRLGTTSDIMI